MSFRLVTSSGDVSDASMINMFASGVVHPGGVVDFTRGADLSSGFVTPATKSSTSTTIFGVCLDYAQGNSDTMVNVIPFCPGQIWEGDCINAATTVQVGKKFSLSTATTPERSRLLNNNSYDQSGSTGIFLVYNVSSASTGSGKVIGEFVRSAIALPGQLTVFN